ncbi:MAG: aldo/keto reductase [Clostridiales Family XIII bacterium]|jgi:predicted aldo/keto reductase-like oxidoreductase|nr:aldo/keto reductase [Clostridiales Family XIII bacterium]
MKKNELGKTGLLVSPVGMGILTMGKTQLSLALDEGADLIRYAMSKGINFLDTAEYYETYPYIRKALERGDFEPVISSKSLSPTYSGMKTAIENARRELCRDVIDIFLLHEIRQEPDFEYRLGAFEYLMEAKDKGIIKAIGISTHHVCAAEKAAETAEIDVIFPLINYMGLGIRNGENSGTKEDMAAAIAKAHAAGKGVFTMKAFGGGNLLANYREALDYVAGLKGVNSTMIGMGKYSDIDAAVDYWGGKLEKEYQPDISGKKMYIDQGDCEACGACIERCTSKAIKFNAQGLAEINTAACVGCGYCANVCPVRAIIFL